MNGTQTVAIDLPHGSPAAPRARIAVAFATVYLVWGTTYFALGQVVHVVPPLFMTAMRFVVAGSVLFLWRRSAGSAAPTREQWLASAWVGALLLLGGYGLTAWAQQRAAAK